MTLQISCIEFPAGEDFVRRLLFSDTIVLSGLVKGEHDLRGGLKGESIKGVQQYDAVEVGVGDGAGVGVRGMLGGE